MQPSLPGTLSTQPSAALGTPRLQGTSPPNGHSFAPISQDQAQLNGLTGQRSLSIEYRRSLDDVQSSSRVADTPSSTAARQDGARGSDRTSWVQNERAPAKSSWLAYLFGGSGNRGDANGSHAANGARRSNDRHTSAGLDGLPTLKSLVSSCACLCPLRIRTWLESYLWTVCRTRVVLDASQAIVPQLCTCVQAVRIPRNTDQGLEGPHSAAAAMQARVVIAEYAWRWLSGGRLLPLTDLQRALALVPCSLPSLMQVQNLPHGIMIVAP